MATHKHGDRESNTQETLIKKPQTSFRQECARPFKEAWDDLRSMKWQREGPLYLFACWIHCLVVVVVWMFLVAFGSGVSSDSPCHPDGSFNAIANTFDWWSPKGLFQITLRTGNLSFESAKAVDIFWNLIIGRGGQSLLAIASTRIWIEYLSVSIATKPASYTTVWLLRFYTEPSAISTLRLARQFFLGRGLASAFKMWFLAVAALFVVAFPTLMSSLAGYTTANQAWVDLGEHGLGSYSQAFPLAFIIHDGTRVGLTENQHVPYDEGARGLVLHKTTYYLPSIISGYQSMNSPNSHADLIGNTTAYVLSYGLSNMAGSAIEKNQNNTTWGKETLQGPPLNITAFYLPSYVFLPNHTKGLWASKGPNDPLFTDESLITYSVLNEAYSMATIQKNGTCQPIQNRYQWGFSFLQLFINIILLWLWTIGMSLVWVKSHLTLKLNGFAAIYNNWKGLLEFTEVLGGQLKAAKIEYLTIDDKQLEHEIEKLLQGGSVTGLPLPQGFYSL